VRRHKSRFQGLGPRNSSRSKLVHNPASYLSNLAKSIDCNHELAAAVYIDQRGRLLFVDLEAVAHHRLVIIGAALLECPFAQTLDNNIRIRDQLDDDIQRSAVLSEETIEVTNLVGCPRISIEKKALRAVRLLETIGNEIIRK